MDRIKLFKKVTGDTDTGKAPMWLEKKYFEFCKDSNIEACYHVLKNGHKMAMIQPMTYWYGF